MVHRPKYKYKTMKHIDENIGQMICVLAINDFSVTSEIWSMKEKFDLSWTYLKLKGLLCERRMKRQDADWQKKSICKTHIW